MGRARQERTLTSYCETWGDGAYITNSDFGRDSAIEAVEKEGGLVSFARHFISNVSKRFTFSIFIDALGR